MISVLITLLIVCVVAGMVFWIITLLPLPAPWIRICQAIVALILLIWLLSWLLPTFHLIR